MTVRFSCDIGVAVVIRIQVRQRIWPRLRSDHIGDISTIRDQPRMSREGFDMNKMPNKTGKWDSL